jgi:hypothetical protein
MSKFRVEKPSGTPEHPVIGVDDFVVGISGNTLYMFSFAESESGKFFSYPIAPTDVGNARKRFQEYIDKRNRDGNPVLYPEAAMKHGLKELSARFNTLVGNLGLKSLEDLKANKSKQVMIENTFKEWVEWLVTDGAFVTHGTPYTQESLETSLQATAAAGATFIDSTQEKLTGIGDRLATSAPESDGKSDNGSDDSESSKKKKRTPDKIGYLKGERLEFYNE